MSATCWTVAALVAVALRPAPALAQPAAPTLEDGFARFEAAAGAGSLFAPGEGAYVLPNLAARLNITSLTAVELVTSFATGEYAQGLEGFYALQIHQRVGRSTGSVQPFVTGGVAGYFNYHTIPGYRSTLVTGDTLVYPERRYAEVSRPFGVVAGAGGRVRAAPHLFVEFGGQAWILEGGVLVMASGGISVPIGRDGR